MPVPPLVFAEGHDVELFTSLDELIAKVEPFVVERGNVTAYDSEGRVIDVRVRRTEGSGLLAFLTAGGVRVTARLGEVEPRHVTQLRALLVAYLTGVPGEERDSGDLQGTSVRRLIERVQALQR
jgi:hypothetical protein